MRRWSMFAAAVGLATAAAYGEVGSDPITRAGLDPTKYVAGATTVVSVRAPWTAAARVAFAKVDIFNTDGNLARLGRGEDETLPTPRAQLIWTADAAAAYAIDCLVAGDARSFIASRFEGARERANRRDMPVARAGDHVAFFMEKGTTGNVYLHSLDAPWAFKECAIVAVVAR